MKVPPQKPHQRSEAQPSSKSKKHQASKSSKVQFYKPPSNVTASAPKNSSVLVSRMTGKPAGSTTSATTHDILRRIKQHNSPEIAKRSTREMILRHLQHAIQLGARAANAKTEDSSVKTNIKYIVLGFNSLHKLLEAQARQLNRSGCNRLSVVCIAKDSSNGNGDTQLQLIQSLLQVAGVSGVPVLLVPGTSFPTSLAEAFRVKRAFCFGVLQEQTQNEGVKAEQDGNGYCQAGVDALREFLLSLHSQSTGSNS